MHMPYARRLVAVLAATAALGLVAGCGGSGDGGGSTAADAGAFVAAANAICSAATDEFNALGNTQQFDSLDDFRTRFGKALAIARQQYADITALDPPADIAPEVQTYLAEGGKSVALSQDLFDRVMAGEDLADAEAATTGSAAAVSSSNVPPKDGRSPGMSRHKVWPANSSSPSPINRCAASFA
jgi:hypothetical protein